MAAWWCLWWSFCGWRLSSPFSPWPLLERSSWEYSSLLVAPSSSVGVSASSSVYKRRKEKRKILLREHFKILAFRWNLAVSCKSETRLDQNWIILIEWGRMILWVSDVVAVNVTVFCEIAKDHFSILNWHHCTSTYFIQFQ